MSKGMRGSVGANHHPALGFEFVTRRGCHLCDVMEGLVEEVFSAQSVDYERRDVDTDASLLRLYGESVPVLLRDGKPVAKIRVDRAQLRRILRRSRRGE